MRDSLITYKRMKPGFVAGLHSFCFVLHDYHLEKCTKNARNRREIGRFVYITRKSLIINVCCGERGIRTPGTSRYDGFQDRCNRPLYHLSWSRLRCKGKALWGKGKILCAYFVRERVTTCNYLQLPATKCGYMPLTETAATTACSHYGFYNNCCCGSNYGHQHTARSV